MAKATAPLPELLRKLADDLGREHMLTLARTFGGTEIFVPQKVQADSRLYRGVGQAVCEWLIEHYADSHVIVPMGPTCPHAVRLARVRALIRQGKKNDEIARLVSCHTKSVQRQRRRMQEDAE